MNSDFAILQLPNGQIALGRDLVPQGGVPEDLPAFYVNRFALDDPQPWKVPQRFILLDSLDELPGELFSEPAEVELDWSPLSPEGFEKVFAAIQNEIEARRAIKMVPVVTEICSIYSDYGQPRAADWLKNIPSVDESSWVYGYGEGQGGFVGVTPERFLSLKEGVLETMALAGTVATGGEEGFVEDPKEIREHELVVSFIEELLRKYGEVERGDRRLLPLEDLTHFATRLRTALPVDTKIDSVIASLHPTPAVGHLPHDSALLSRLQMLRAKLHCPAHFGAPFGLMWEGQFHSVVSIRGIFQEGNQLHLPSGCGIIAQSNLEQEWNELALKRQAVRNLLSLPF